MQPKDYKDNFFEYHLQGALASAEAIIPIIKDYINPASVIDIGCGIGAWLSVWKKNGITDMLGLDGDYIDKDKLIIDKSLFQAVDLEKGFTVNRKFDLVCCLEVAEHLPVKCSDLLINSLCQAGDIILFSAAIPGQEGTLHINEQYPEYWVTIFKKNGYVPVDYLRLKIWNNTAIQWWYRQNILVFIKESSLDNYPVLKQFYIENNSVLPLVHPELFEYKVNKAAQFESILNSPKATIKYFLANFSGKKKR